MSFKKNDLVEKLLECQEELEDYKDDVKTWTDSMEELYEIEDAFETDERNKLHGKTILDIGTDYVKPLYIALKFEPDKIIGINEDRYSFASDLEQKSKLLTETEIKFYYCNLFDKETLRNILRKENQGTFDFVLVSKTLHHLRTGKCIANERNQKHKCPEDEKCCIYKFEEQKIFKELLQLGKRVIIYEAFYPHDEDDDKIRGRGGHFTIKEWQRIFSHLSEKYRIKLIKPLKDSFNKNKISAILRKVDIICFYVETK